ncbi:hypothetical protein BAU07_20975 [Bordetella flabilis]|uniref:Fimbrial protein n=1 Tax=Bordetella flabilis TaxID=463014 RepID=A0A193GKM8_9BORD|nr:hypothetical protein BAU07_20975 [Bordetella flabilis]
MAPPEALVPLASYPGSATAPRPPVVLARAGIGTGLSALAPAVPLPVQLGDGGDVTAELPPCEPLAAPDSTDAPGLHEVPSPACPAVPTGDPSVLVGSTPVLDYVPPPPGSSPPVNWGRPLGTPKPWFANVTPQEGMVLGDRSLTYRSVDGPSLSVGSLTPFTPAWGSAAPIGGVQLSNLTAASDATVPEGKLGYSSVWGRINNTDTSQSAGGVDYGPPAGTSSLRYGLTPDLTLEGQVQSARALTATGLGTTYSLGRWGRVQGGATQSHFDESQGWRYRLGYNVDVFDSLTLGYANELTSSGYGDLSNYEDGAVGSRQLRSTFSAGVPITGWGQISGTYSGLRDAGGDVLERRYGFSQSMMLSPHVRFAVGADHDVVSGDYALNMQLSLPIGGR